MAGSRPPVPAWQALKDYLGKQIDADSKIHQGFIEAGDHVRAAAIGGLLTANRNTSAR